MKPGLLVCGVILLCCAAPAQAGELFRFTGHMDFDRGVLGVEFLSQADNRLLALTVNREPQRGYTFQITAAHLRLAQKDLSTEITGSLRFVREKTGPWDVVLGRAVSRYTLWDYAPYGELSMLFEWRDQRLWVRDFSVGHITAKGYVETRTPFNLDMALGFNGVDLSDFLSFWTNSQSVFADGLVQGEIRGQGTPEHLALKGRLESRDGVIKNLKYDRIELNIAGVYPRMNISDSTISQTDGWSFTVAGPFDLADREHFQKQIEALTISPLVSSNDSKTEWTLKRSDIKKSGTLELKYLMNKNSGRIEGAEDTAIIGVERKLEF
ncbi:MAG: hypothetical protein HQL23_08535 [Candidatus Omnitrophica bacterium]|nr:hypothetical protein [Candidatus Omnitrophota bacterium]